MTSEVALPQSGDVSVWSESERALVEAAGLVQVDRSGRKELADRATVEAFLHQCRRTGLDPIARQIYCLPRRSKAGPRWTIQISIDGARLIAERTGEYQGQTPVQWTGDGRTWVDVWLDDVSPRAARVGVFRKGFREPLVAVARWDSYVPLEPVWENGRKTGEQVASMWRKMPDLMLAKVAEMLALRKAFPQDLSGLYSGEEMQQSQQPARDSVQPARPVQAPRGPSRDWGAQVAAVESVEALRGLWQAAQAGGELAVKIGGRTLKDVLMERAGQLADGADAADGTNGDDAAPEESSESEPESEPDLAVDVVTGEVF